MTFMIDIHDAFSQKVHPSLLAPNDISEQYYKHTTEIFIFIKIDIDEYAVKLDETHLMVIQLLLEDMVTQKLKSVTAIECFILTSCRKMA